VADWTEMEEPKAARDSVGMTISGNGSKFRGVEASWKEEITDGDVQRIRVGGGLLGVEDG
jgi:hypothetical protein